MSLTTVPKRPPDSPAPGPPKITYAPPNVAALAAEADIRRLKETLETGVFSERERGKLAHELMAAERARERAINPHLYR